MKGIVKVGIVGTGKCIPDRILDNAELSRMVDTSDEWIVTRSGIRERRIAAPDVACSDLGVVAAREAIEEAELRPEEIEMIIAATSTPDHLFPTTACMIQKKLGCPNAGAFDLLAACSGFIYALTTGWQYVATGQSSNVLIVGVETLSKITNYKDRSTCVLFGDAAGAVVLRNHNGGEILHCKLGADGNLSDMIMLPAGGSRMPPSIETIRGERHYLEMKGREVYKFAVTKMVEVTEEALAKCNLTTDSISLLIPHQVNLRIIESAAEKLKLPMDRVFVNIDRYGNTSAASIPVALNEASRSGRLKKGDIVVMVAFGAGLTWGSSVIRW